jgi:predicted DNA-binding transcriptional regulator AlpA
MATASNTFETLLNERDVARLTGLSLASVRRWRLLKQGPRFIKLNSAVRYRPKDVAMWLESRPSGGEHQAGAR